MADDPGEINVADFTHAWMRRVEQLIGNSDRKLDNIIAILSPRETRISRMEHSVGEIKFDMTNVDGHMVTFTTDTLKLVDKIDTLNEKIDGLDGRVAGIEGKLG
jgi:peptidoglycan hydrolase CwlO-like protein